MRIGGNPHPHASKMRPLSQRGEGACHSERSRGISQVRSAYTSASPFPRHPGERCFGSAQHDTDPPPEYPHLPPLSGGAGGVSFRAERSGVEESLRCVRLTRAPRHSHATPVRDVSAALNMTPTLPRSTLTRHRSAAEGEACHSERSRGISQVRSAYTSASPFPRHPGERCFGCAQHDTDPPPEYPHLPPLSGGAGGVSFRAEPRNLSGAFGLHERLAIPTPPR